MKTTAQLITKKLRKLDKERYTLECALRIVNKEPGYLKEIDALKSSIDELMKKNAHLTMENERLIGFLAEWEKSAIPRPFKVEEDNAQCGPADYPAYLRNVENKSTIGGQSDADNVEVGDRRNHSAFFNEEPKSMDDAVLSSGWRTNTCTKCGTKTTVKIDVPWNATFYTKPEELDPDIPYCPQCGDKVEWTMKHQEGEDA